MPASNSTPKATGREAELKELAIKAVKQHSNYRGKPLGRLPYIIDQLVTKAYYGLGALEGKVELGRDLEEVVGPPGYGLARSAAYWSRDVLATAAELGWKSLSVTG